MELHAERMQVARFVHGLDNGRCRSLRRGVTAADVRPVVSVDAEPCDGERHLHAPHQSGDDLTEAYAEQGEGRQQHQGGEGAGHAEVVKSGSAITCGKKPAFFGAFTTITDCQACVCRGTVGGSPPRVGGGACSYVAYRESRLLRRSRRHGGVERVHRGLDGCGGAKGFPRVPASRSGAGRFPGRRCGGADRADLAPAPPALLGVAVRVGHQAASCRKVAIGSFVTRASLLATVRDGWRLLSLIRVMNGRDTPTASASF